MFGFNSKKKSAPAAITINGTLAIDGYTPDPVNGKMFVCEVPDLTVLRSINEKDQRGVKMLLATAEITDVEIASKFGNKIIIVDKQFKNLPKKEKLILIQIENDKEEGYIDRYPSNLDNSLSADETIVDISSKLNAMEDYGVRKVNKAIQKKEVFGQASMNRTGKYLYKQAKKSAKAEKKSTKKAAKEVKDEGEVLRMPDILKGAADMADDLKNAAKTIKSNMGKKSSDTSEASI